MAKVTDNNNVGPGAFLAKQRKAKGLSEEEVADKLHLSPSIIRKLEQNNYDDNLPDAFARGYLRNYSKLLDIDPQEVIASYTQLIGQSKVQNYYEPSRTIDTPTTAGISMNHLVIMVVVAVPLIALIVWFMARGEDLTEVNTEADASIITSDTSPGTIQIQETQTLIVQPSDSILADEQSNSDPDASPVSSATVEPELEPAQTAAPTGFVATTEAELRLVFIDDVWVQITDSNGEVLAVGLKTAGRSFEVSGVAPISVVLGKPRAVNIAYNNTEVDLACFPAGSTARFTLNSPIACEN